MTVYDAETRSQVQAEQGKAALRSLFELKDVTGDTVELYFGPTAPEGKEDRWIQTVPGMGLVRLLPRLWAGAVGLRRKLEAR